MADGKYQSELRNIIATFHADQQAAALATERTQAQVNTDNTNQDYLNTHYEVITTWAARAAHHCELILAFEQRLNTYIGNVHGDIMPL